jgi:hypothetical protein
MFARTLLSAAVGISVGCNPPVAAQAPTSSPSVSPEKQRSYADLLALHQELEQYMLPGFTSSVVLDSGARVGEQYSDAVMAAKLRGLDQFDRRLSAIDVRSWPRPQQVDYLTVKSLLNGYRFNLQVLRPWKRDPGFYLDPLLQVAFEDLPAEPSKRDGLRRTLAQIAPMLAQARANLTEATADFTDLALFNLENSDGVNHYHRYRKTPPAGIIGWYDDLLSRAVAARSPIEPEVRAARTALAEFRDWLRAERPRITAPSGVGPARFQWYMTNVRMVPYSAAEMLTLAKREHQRFSADLALTRHRNRGLPQLPLSRSAEEQQAKVSQTDREVRAFLRDQEIITIPDYIGELGSNTPFIVRPGGPNFWEQIQFRNPIPDHLHAVIPGHRFDAEMANRDHRPIRSSYADGVRLEGWAMYLEEAMMRAGAVKSPRAEELIQLFGIFRAARVPADINMQYNRWNAAQAVKYMREVTPWLDENVARVDAEIYLRRPPGYGVAYLIGKLQMDALLADRARQLGDKFVLRDFHDQFMAVGQLPISLIRYEMTGYSDEVGAFWVTPPIPS